MAYWRNADWWGIGPGAHSHVDGTRWWNVKHPRTYAQRIQAGLSPQEAEETTTPEQRRLEKLMLGLRIRQGLVQSEIGCSVQQVASLVERGLIDAESAGQPDARIVLTRNGRLLADSIVRELST
jgi:oxygen-independent coproporphyrinogen-3 oxidase